MTLKDRRLLGLLAAVPIAAITALVPAGAPAQTASTGTYLHARMSPTSAYPHCYGGARYESHPGWREFEITLHGIPGLSGKTVIVRVHGDVVGRMRVHHGYAHLERHSGVPAMAAGDLVRVRTGSGTLVSRGQLHRMHHQRMM